MVCADCGHRPVCPECGSSLAGAGRGLVCRTCGWGTPGRRCRDCGGTTFVPLAAGTRRLADELRAAVDVPVAVLEGYDADVPPAPAVLVMTRGSVLDEAPGDVGGIVVGDVDTLMRRPSVDAPEDTLRLLMALGSWIGGTDATMSVVTREPEAPAVVALRRWDAGGFWRSEASEREPFPPARSAVAVTAPDRDTATALAAALGDGVATLVLGPAPAEGGHRLLVLTTDRPAVVDRLSARRRDLSADNVTLVVDVDPVDLA